MSKFSGSQHKGIMRSVRAEKCTEAYERALSNWNDGTGRIWPNRNPDLARDLKNAAHPMTFLPKAMRPVPMNQWPILDQDMPSTKEVAQKYPTGLVVTIPAPTEPAPSAETVKKVRSKEERLARLRSDR